MIKTGWMFAYASNMHLPDIERWLRDNAHPPESVAQVGEVLKMSGRRAVLDGWEVCWNRCSSHRGGGAANIREAAGQRVYGVAYRISNGLLKLFDAKEGYPTSYDRRVVPVTLLDSGDKVDGWAYVSNGNRPEPVWPTREYKRLVLAGAHSWGLPTDYVFQLSAIPTAD